MSQTNQLFLAIALTVFATIALMRLFDYYKQKRIVQKVSETIYDRTAISDRLFIVRKAIMDERRTLESGGIVILGAKDNESIQIISNIRLSKVKDNV